MPRILMSFALVAVALGAIAFGATSAFFSDTENSLGNTFVAGAIDLKIDNESYYNGVANASTTWTLTDLTIEKFFDFNDLKPSDYGEDTISIHVDTNDSYLCANVTLTSNNDNSQTEPESEVDADGLASGELANLVNFIWWADDGDNVLEDDENVISQGPIGALEIGESYPLALADSDENIWTGVAGPVPGESTVYIGKAWCFGTIAADPLDQDDYDSPAGDNDDNNVAGEPEDGGISCDGSALGNESQTDSLTADVSFEAVQSRNNKTFQCEEPTQACVPGEVNVFANGSFENPEVTNGGQWDVFSAAISSWTIAWRDGLPTTYNSQTRPEPGNFELHEGVLGAAYDGDQYIELDSDWDGNGGPLNGEPASTVISQVISTVPGDTYTVSYAFAPRPNTDAANNHVVVKWNGTVLDTAGPMAGGPNNLVVSDWIPKGPFSFVATSSSAVVSFTDMGTPDSLGSFIDKVVVTHAVCTFAP